MTSAIFFIGNFTSRHDQFQSEAEETHRSCTTVFVFIITACGVDSGDHAGVAGIVVESETAVIELNRIACGIDVAAIGLHFPVDDDAAFAFQLRRNFFRKRRTAACREDDHFPRDISAVFQRYSGGGDGGGFDSEIEFKALKFPQFGFDFSGGFR
jgi:hypothetical protein